MNKEERFNIKLNQEDVQNIINCYEKDIKLIEQLQQENKELHNKIDRAIELLLHFSGCQICEHTQELAIKVEEILKGDVDD